MGNCSTGAQASPAALLVGVQGRHYTLDQYLQRNDVLGFVAPKDTRIVAERYSHGASRGSRFLSNSVQKSMTSTLVGVAVEEGRIGGLGDPVIKYLPAPADSGYSRVNLQQVLEMATGFASSENPEDPNSTIHRPSPVSEAARLIDAIVARLSP